MKTTNTDTHVGQPDGFDCHPAGFDESTYSLAVYNECFATEKKLVGTETQRALPTGGAK